MWSAAAVAAPVVWATAARAVSAVFRGAQLQFAGHGHRLLGVVRRGAHGTGHEVGAGQVGAGQVGVGLGLLVAEAAAVGEFECFLKVHHGQVDTATRTVQGSQGDQAGRLGVRVVGLPC